MVRIHLKVYGTARKWHHELWVIDGKLRHVKVRRDKEGNVIAWEHLEPTERIEEPKYREISFVIEAETGKEAYEQLVELYNQWEWIPGTFEVES